jgi:hypothetical protein
MLFGMSSFSIANKGYVGIGATSNEYFNDFWEYTSDSISTGINSIDAIDINISPNPTNDRLYINGLTKDAAVVIADMTGRLVNVPISGKEIDVSSLPSGVYLIAISSGEGKKTIKFTKL